MDTRLITFLEVVETKNYTRASENLHITQPAVTRHIRSLEEEFGVRLFRYDGKKMTMTLEAERLESYARSLQKNYRDLKASFQKENLTEIKLGLTKTIADYAYVDELAAIIRNHPNDIALMTDNTEALLARLRNAELDFLIVEGRFQKSEFEYEILREERFTGLCSVHHPFCEKRFKIGDIQDTCLLIREPGSGSREILEEKLRYRGHDVFDFSRRITCSSLHLMAGLLKREVGITFGYESILGEEKNLGAFDVDGITDRHEFSLIALKGTGGIELFHALSDGAGSFR